MSLDTTTVRQTLTRGRDELARKLQRIRRDSAHRAQPLAADSADRAQETENDEVLAGLEAPVEALLKQYEHALGKLAAGKYGACETCGRPIEPRRLQAEPQATRCVSCARAAG